MPRFLKTLAALLAILIAAVAVSISGTRAHASDFNWDWGTKQVRPYPVKRHKKKWRRRAPAVAAWQYQEEHGPICLSNSVKVISTEHTSDSNAMEAAKKMWMFTTQWEHGSKWMQLELAEDYRWHCGPSNAMDTISGRLSETANKLIGQEGQNVRCVIAARPCRARLEQAEGRR